MVVARGAILAYGTEENHEKIPVRIPSVLTETQTKHLPNTSLECYAYPSLVGPENTDGNGYKDYCILGCDIT